MSDITHLTHHERVVLAYMDCRKKITELERENAALNHKLNEILTNKNYEGGVQFWINKHDEVLLREASLLAENAALREQVEHAIKAGAKREAELLVMLGKEAQP